MLRAGPFADPTRSATPSNVAWSVASSASTLQPAAERTPATARTVAGPRLRAHGVPTMNVRVI
jgi:hypothetical protein